jgi:hypothetical protein
MKSLQKHEFEILTDHYQFFIEDAEAVFPGDDLWNVDEVSRRLAVRDGFIAVGTARFGGLTRIHINVYDACPVQARETCDFRIECRLRVLSGRIRLSAPELVVAEGPGFQVAPGLYDVAICYVNINQVTDEEQVEGPDEYQVTMWPTTQ